MLTVPGNRIWDYWWQWRGGPRVLGASAAPEGTGKASCRDCQVPGLARRELGKSGPSLGPELSRKCSSQKQAGSADLDWGRDFLFAV